VLVLAALGGVAWLGLGELRVRAMRRTRLAVSTGPVSPVADDTPKVGAVGSQVMTGIRRLGQQSAVRDPAKLSVLRNQLMQAGYFNREAPVIFLGVKAAAMVVATLGVLLTMPMLLKGQGGLGGVLLAGSLADAASRGLLPATDIAWVVDLTARRRSRRYARETGGPRAEEAMRDYQQAVVELGFLHSRYLRGVPPPDFAARGRDYVARISALRPSIAFPGQVVPTR